MLGSLATVYLVLKFGFLFGLVRAQAKSEPLGERWLFLSVLYTAGVAGLSFVFLVMPGLLSWAPWQRRVAATAGISPWLAWLVETLLLSALYFRLLGRSDGGFAFVVLLALGIGLAWF